MTEHNKFVKELGLPESFCFAPYANVDCDQDGSLRACYRSKSDCGNWKNYNLVEELNNSDFQKLRDDLWNGRTTKNCRQCHVREEHGLNSTRHKFNRMMELTYPEHSRRIAERIKQDHLQQELDYVVTAEFRVSSLCNLRCLHCSADSSTQWIAVSDNKEVYRKSLSSEYTDAEQFLTHASNLSTIEFSGGEPLIDPQHTQWLGAIPNKQEVKLFYHSNLNIKNIEQYFELWEQFKQVTIRVSIDTSPRIYEYFRNLGSIDAINVNLDKLKQTSVKVLGTVTVNLLTMLDWTNVVKYWVSNNWKLHISFVDDHPLSAANLPNKLKQIALEDLEASKQLLTYADHDYVNYSLENIESIEAFLNRKQVDRLPEHTVQYINYCDNITGQSYIDYVPQLKEYMHER